jgi:hypothetical protein
MLICRFNQNFATMPIPFVGGKADPRCKTHPELESCHTADLKPP